MKIAFIHPHWPGSKGTGATYSATQVVRGLANRGHNVHVICTDPAPENAAADGLQLHNLPVKNHSPLPTNVQLNRTIRQRAMAFEGYDIVHSYLTSAVPALSTIGRKTSASTVVTLNAYIGICAKNDLRYLDKESCGGSSLAKCAYCTSRTSFGNSDHGPAYRTASRLGNLELIREGKQGLEHIDAFRAPSEHVRQNYVQFGYPADPIHVIPHPLNESFVTEHVSDFSEPYRLLYVGYLKSKKGVDKLVPIISRLRERTDRAVTLTVVGSGPRERPMREQVAEFGVEESVEFRGFVPNEKLPKTYASHDLFVYPSIWEEPLGRVYLEALATGTPIISTDYGNIDEIMGDGGIAVEGTVESFSEAIETLFKSGQLSSMSAAASQQATTFERSEVVSQINDLYTTLVGEDV